MVWLALLVSGVLSLGVWPESVGAPDEVVEGVEIYTVEPEEEYGIVAVAPLSPPLGPNDATRLAQLAALAQRLPADAVLLLRELAPEGIPTDPEEPLPATDRYAAAVFLFFPPAMEEPPSPICQARRGSASTHPGRRAEQLSLARCGVAPIPSGETPVGLTAAWSGSSATPHPPAAGR